MTQGDQQASVRAVTGTAYDYDGDWHALFDLAGIATGDFNGRLLTWINLKLGTSYNNLPGAMAAFATANGATNFGSIGTFSASLDPFSLFTYDLDFVANTYKGGTQPYGNNNNDGRFFRDPSNVSATWCPDATGLLIAQSAAGLRRTSKGVFSYMSGTQGLLHNRDLRVTHQLTVSGGAGTFTSGETVTSTGGGTGVYVSSLSTSTLFAITGGSGTFSGTLTGGSSGATKTISAAANVWTHTNMTPTLTTGADGVANKATLLTATANGATSAQTVAGNVQRVYSLDIKRVTGTGTVKLSLDNNVTKTDITALINSGGFSQQFITQLMSAGSTVVIELGTSGDAVAVDFVQLCTPSISGLNIPTQQRYGITNTTLVNSQTRPNVASADAGPLFAATSAPFAFYWQGRSERPTGGYVITSDGSLFCNVDGNGAVHFSENPADSVTPNGVWRTGLGNVNKVAGWVTSSNIKVACNGQLGSLGTGVVFSGSQTHWDLGTNGAGANTIMGINERVAFAPNVVFSDANLIAMTT